MQLPPSLQTALLVVGVLALTVVAFAVLGWVISFPSGWHALAERYRTQRRFPDHQRRGESARMRMLISYKGILDFGSDADGIYMGTLIPIPNHPRLFIPWSEIRVIEPSGWRLSTVFLLGPDKIPLRGRWESLTAFLLETRGDTSATVSGTISSSF